jgi:hypothetical protein
MERVNVLINRLQEQLNENAASDNLLVTAHMLVKELQQKHEQKTSSKVAVTMPFIQGDAYTAPTIVRDILDIPQPLDTEDFIAEEEIVAKEAAVAYKQTNFFEDAFTAIPTLPFDTQKEVYELNDAMVVEDESINTKWQGKQVEVATVLERTPIKDFKKAIYINDRYLFINELFKGDEAMYERSLKTIQGFSILPEATFWIQRELKLKLGWGEGTQAVKLFDQLVIRRFS